MPYQSVRFLGQNKTQEKSESERDSQSAQYVEGLDLATGDKVASICKVYWSRKKDRIYARLSIRRKAATG